MSRMSQSVWMQVSEEQVRDRPAKEEYKQKNIITQVMLYKTLTDDGQ